MDVGPKVHGPQHFDSVRLFIVSLPYRLDDNLCKLPNQNESTLMKMMYGMKAAMTMAYMLLLSVMIGCLNGTVDWVCFRC